MAGRTDKINFRLSVFDFDKALGEELRKARATVVDIEQKIIKAFNDSDRVKALRAIAGTSDMAQKYSVYPRINVTHIEADVMVDLADQSKAATYFNISEKTANLLLSGKLLTDDQKKALIKRMGFDLDTLNEPAA